MQKHEDQLLKLEHGEVLVNSEGKYCFRFRCGPVTKHAWFSYHLHPKPGKKKSAYRQGRPRHGYRNLLESIKAAQDGFKVRKGLRYYLLMVPRFWDDLPNSHPEKNWKSYRKTQWSR